MLHMSFPLIHLSHQVQLLGGRKLDLDLLNTGSKGINAVWANSKKRRRKKEEEKKRNRVGEIR